MVEIRLSALFAAAESKEFILGGEMRSACLFRENRLSHVIVRETVLEKK
jgi:hypothetical protein